MIIRKAEYSDYDSITNLIIQFFDESIHNFLFEVDPASIQRSFQVMMRDHIVIVAIKDDKVIGVIAGTLGPADFNHGELVANEIIWYVTKSYRATTVGLKLFAKWEQESERKGATHITMGYMENLHPEKLKQFYVDKGYKPMQTQYIRSVK